jgi:hypothetical protein
MPMKTLVKSLFLIVSVVNLAPVIGAVSADHMERLYGLPFDDPNLVILMRHRAVLFGIVGALLVVSAFRPSLRPIGSAAGLVSMLSFAFFACLVGNYNAELQRVVIIDLVASVLLVCAMLAIWWERRRGESAAPRA